MADSPATTNPPVPPNLPDKYEVTFSHYSALGRNIYSIDKMAVATGIVFDAFMVEIDGFSRLGEPSAAMVKHIEHWRGATAFMITHMEELAKALREQYDTEDEEVSA